MSFKVNEIRNVMFKVVLPMLISLVIIEMTKCSADIHIYIYIYIYIKFVDSIQFAEKVFDLPCSC